MVYDFYQKDWNLKKVEKILANLYDKKYVIHVRNLKQALKYELVLENVHRVINFNQET